MLLLFLLCKAEVHFGVMRQRLFQNEILTRFMVSVQFKPKARQCHFGAAVTVMYDVGAE